MLFDVFDGGKMKKLLIWVDVIGSALLLVPVFIHWYCVVLFGVAYTDAQLEVVSTMFYIWLFFQSFMTVAIITGE